MDILGYFNGVLFGTYKTQAIVSDTSIFTDRSFLQIKMVNYPDQGAYFFNGISS